MNFHFGARDIELKDGHILTAFICVEEEWKPVSLDLDDWIGNNDGILVWGLKNFSHGATDVRLSEPETGWAPVLRAKIANTQGWTTTRTINLAECIAIVQGKLICRPDARFVVEPVTDDKGEVHFFQYRRYQERD